MKHTAGSFNPYSLNSHLNPNGPTLFFTFAVKGRRGGSNLKSTPSKILQEKKWEIIEASISTFYKGNIPGIYFKQVTRKLL